MASQDSVHSREQEDFGSDEESYDETSAYMQALREYAETYSVDHPDATGMPRVEPRLQAEEDERPAKSATRKRFVIIPGESRADMAVRLNAHGFHPRSELVRSLSNTTTTTDYTIPGTRLVGVIRENNDFRTLDAEFARSPASGFGHDCRIQSLYPLGFLSRDIADGLARACNVSGRGISNFYQAELLSYYTGRYVQFDIHQINPLDPIESLNRILLHRDLPEGATLPMGFQRLVGEGHTVIFIKWEGNCYLYDAQTRTRTTLQIGGETQVLSWINFLLTGPYISFSVMIYPDETDDSDGGYELPTSPPPFSGGKKTRRSKRKIKKTRKRRCFKSFSR